MRPGHLNQDLVRYVPHRVWVVQATLIPGKRPVYAKRVFYIDDDSSQIAHSHAHDGRRELCHVHQLDAPQSNDEATPWLTPEVY